MVMGWSWDGPKSGRISAVPPSCHRTTNGRYTSVAYLTCTAVFQKAPCENKFQAIVNAFLASKACDRTGLVAIACVRHGCYAPNALVDLFRGEQQKNVDFAFLQALMTTRVDPQQGVMLIYDIVCQYIVHLRERIGEHLPDDLVIDQAIGLFHVHGHKDECFFRYTIIYSRLWHCSGRNTGVSVVIIEFHFPCSQNSDLATSGGNA